jgi:3-oxoadipate enol-lactonase
MQARLNGATLDFADEGPRDRPAVLLHHSLAGTLALFDELAARLAGRYRVVRFDARGHGASETTPAPYDFETLTADVVALLDHLGIGRAHFLGLSMGGMIGQYMGLLHPDRVASLMLVSTTSRIPPEAHAIWDERIAAVTAAGMAGQVAGSITRWLSPTARTERPDLVHRLATSIEATPLEGFVGWARAIRELDVTDRLGAITAPTLVVVGALDPGTPVAAAEAIHARIPGSRLVVMPGLSHMLPIEAPDAFGAIVDDFLADVATTTG